MYKLVFESNMNLSYFDLENIIGIILSVFIFLILWRFQKQKKFKFFLFLSLVVFAIIQLFGIVKFYTTQKEIIKALKNKTYSTTEGYIKNFHAMPKSGHDAESFNVNGIHFEILYTGNFPNAKTQFYTLTKNRNGPIKKNGQKVKIYYIKDSLPKICIPFTKKCIIFNKNQENKIIKMWLMRVR